MDSKPRDKQFWDKFFFSLLQFRNFIFIQHFTIQFKIRNECNRFDCFVIHVLPKMDKIEYCFCTLINLSTELLFDKPEIKKCTHFQRPHEILLCLLQIANSHWSRIFQSVTRITFLTWIERRKNHLNWN